MDTCPELERVITDIAARYAFDLWAGDGTTLTLQQDEPVTDLVLTAAEPQVVIIELGLILQRERIPDPRLGIFRGRQGWIPLFFENVVGVRRAALVVGEEVVVMDQAEATGIARHTTRLAADLADRFGPGNPFAVTRGSVT